MNAWIMRTWGFAFGVVLASMSVYSQPVDVQLSGVIRDREGKPVGGATIKAVKPENRKQIRATYSTSNGRYSLVLPSSGQWLVSVHLVGYVDLSDSLITTDGATSLDVSLDSDPLTSEAIVVAASRVREKAIEAPASVSVVDKATIAEINAVTPSSYVQGLPGVNLVDKGVGRTSLSIRGYADVMGGGTRALADMRNVRLPAIGFDLNYYMTVVGPDIERIEVIRGPSSALFGPNTDGGIMNVVTRSPFASEGATVDVMIGERDVIQTIARAAVILNENVALKISGGYMQATDWQYTDPIEQANRDAALAVPGVDPDTVLIGKRDPHFNRGMIDARLDVVLGEVQATVEGGYYQTINGIETAPAGVGGIQIDHAEFWYAHARVTWERLFAQTFINTASSTNNYLLRTGNPSNDHASEIITRLQHGFDIGDIQTFTYGGDLFLTYPDTAASVYGQFKDSNSVVEAGAYLQSETRLFDDRLHATITARFDKHSELDDPVFTPRVALTYRLRENLIVRGMYNHGFQTPPPGAFFFDVVGANDVFGFGALDPSLAVKYRVRGVPQTGYTFTKVNGQYNFYSPFVGAGSAPLPVNGVASLWPVVVQALAAQGVDISQIPQPTPEQVGGIMRTLDAGKGAFGPEQTSIDDVQRAVPLIRDFYEVGIQGEVLNGLTVSLDLFRQQYYNRYLLKEATPNVFMDPADLQAYFQQMGMSAEQAAQLSAAIGGIPLGTVSADQAIDKTAIMATSVTQDSTIILHGFDLGMQFRLTNNWEINGSFSWFEANDLGVPPSIGMLGLRFIEPDLGLSAQLRYRHNGGFTVVQTTYVETNIAPYNLLDMMVSYRMPFYQKLSLALNLTNILDHSHQEMIGNPAIGRMSTLRATLSL